MSGWLWLVWFEFTSSARSAARSFLPWVAAGVVLVGLNLNLEGALRLLVGLGDPVVAYLLSTVAGWALAQWTAQRMAFDRTGWMLHLPLSGRQRECAWLLTIVLAQTPIVLPLCLAAVIAGESWRTAPLILIAVSIGALHWWRASDQRIGPSIRNWIAHSTTGVVALLPLGAAMLFCRNDGGESLLSEIAVRCGSWTAFALSALGVADRLSKHRPVWGWARTLPIAASTRVRHDLYLALAVSSPAAVLSLVWFPAEALSTLVGLVWFAACSAAAARKLRSAGLEVAWAAALVIPAAARWVWVTPLILSSVPLWLRIAVARDRAYPVGRWDSRFEPSRSCG